MKEKKDAYAALRYPEFRYFVAVQFLFTVAILIQEVLIGYQLYKITHDPLSLGFIGLAEAVPYICLALFGGYFADKRDKKVIVQICCFVMISCSLLLLYSSYNLDNQLVSNNNQKTLIFTIYLTIFLMGVTRGFNAPAWSSLKPFLVPAQHYSNLATWSSQFWQSGAILGPALAGFLYVWLGLSGSLILVIILLIICFILVSLISKKPIQNTSNNTGVFESLKEGIDYVFKNKILLYSITLDMFSVLFGGVIAILPIFAEDILHVGAEGLGILRAAPGVGAVLTMFATAYFPPTNQAWRNMLIAVAGFGVATLVFALSTNFLISIIALFLTGAFDSISVVVRQTILQVLPPDNMRGRINSVNGIFVSTSNELGAFESGVAAKLLGTVTSVVFGGIMTLLTVTYIYSRSKELFSIKLERK
jgi:MFS family permease